MEHMYPFLLDCEVIAYAYQPVNFKYRVEFFNYLTFTMCVSATPICTDLQAILSSLMKSHRQQLKSLRKLAMVLLSDVHLDYYSVLIFRSTWQHLKFHDP